jgi:phosphoribosyl 1,2-cyclic phosphodiesterase
MRLTVLASGSGGNSILVEAEGTRVLVDAGLAPRELAKRFERTTTGVRLDDVQAVLCTHEHTDHAQGVPALASAGLAVYATEGTARALKLSAARTVVAGERIAVGALAVLPVAVPHDSVEPVAFLVEDASGSAGVLTDIGHPTPEVAAAFAGCDILVLETNHDVDMLRGGAYPQSLKRRIGGRMGHLSNEQAAEMLRLMAATAPAGAGARLPRAQVLILAHLSPLNNRPRFARSVVEKQLALLGVRPRLLVAVQERPLAPLLCLGGKVQILPAIDDRQLCIAFPDH